MATLRGCEDRLYIEGVATSKVFPKVNKPRGPQANGRKEDEDEEKHTPPHKPKPPQH